MSMLDIQRRRATAFFALLSLPATAMGIALSVQISALSWLLSTKYQLAIEEIGLVWAAGPIAGIIGQILIGLLSDKLWFWGGRRSGFIILGSILASLSIIMLPSLDIIVDLIGFATIVGVAASVALILDLAVNVGLNPTRAIVADLTHKGEERSKGFIWMQTMSGVLSVGAYGIGAIFGNITLIYVGGVVVILFGVLPTLFLTEPREIDIVEEEKSSNSLFSFASSLSPLLPILVYDLIALSQEIVGFERESFLLEWVFGSLTIVAILHALTRRDGEEKTVFRKIVSAHALSWIGIQSLFIYLVPFLEFRFPTWDEGEVGRFTSQSFLALNTMGAVAPILILRPLAQHFRRVHVHAAALAVMAISFFAIWQFAASQTAILVLLLLAGIGWGSIVSLPFAIFSERVNAARMGLYMGLFNLSVVLPQLIASLGVGSILSAATDKGLLFLIGAVCFALSAIAWLFINRAASAPTGR